MDQIHGPCRYPYFVSIAGNDCCGSGAIPFDLRDNLCFTIPQHPADGLSRKDIAARAIDLIYVGRSTKHKLYQVNIITIGNIAKSDPSDICSSTAKR
jgi:hypothetical protein